MKRSRFVLAAAAGIAILGMVLAAPNANPPNVLSGQSAFASYQNEKPGTWRKITPADLPKPFATESARNQARVVARPNDAWPQALPGFKVELYETGLNY